jgi:uncharacterized membrane protein SpoIIM required for sporulation
MFKKVLKIGAILAAGVAGLGFGYTVAAQVTMRLPATVSEKARQWISTAVALLTGIASMVLATKLSRKFLGAGGPGVSVATK